MIYKFTPILKSAPWGGDRLCQLKGMARSGGPVGESWELSDLPGMETHVAEGPEKGCTLAELTARHGVSLLGSRALKQCGGRFPLLLKFLDSKEWLSLQVHPSDDTARELEGADALGKSEMWYVVDATPGARLILGFNSGVTAADYVAAEGSAKLMDLVRYHDVAPDMEFRIPAGTVHALGPGCLVAEVQQPCDITYRVYDHGRPRELHLDKARRSFRFVPADEPWHCQVHAHTLAAGLSAPVPPVEGSFVAVMVIRGECTLDSMPLAGGSTALISADHGVATISAQTPTVYLTISI